MDFLDPIIFSSVIVAVMAGGIGSILGGIAAKRSPKRILWKAIAEREDKKALRSTAARRAYRKFGKRVDWKRAKKHYFVAALSGVVGLSACITQSIISPDVGPSSRKGRGTGFIIADGFAATNHHVAGKCDRIFVSYKGEEKPVKLISSDEKADIAIITLPKEVKGPALPVRAWPMAQLGEKFHTIGYPYMSGPQTGIKYHEHMVSGLTGWKNEVMAFQFSNNIYHGNSGSPAIDVNGNVIGIIHSSIDNGANYAARAVTLEVMMKAMNIEGAPVSDKPWDQSKIEDGLAKSVVAVYCEKSA